MVGYQIFPREEPAWFPADDLRDFHGIVAHVPTKLERLAFGFHEDGTEGIIWRTKPRKGEDEDDDDED
jgi:solute carrier family 6 amino acid/orphan transporter-like 15/16/17/18/20